MEVLSRPAEEFVNNPDIETAWVMKAVKHMEIHFNILRSVEPRLLRLTKFDDEIYEEFRKEFPDTCVMKVDVEIMKGPEGKEKWRQFCQKFEHVPDYNFGTLLRINSEGDYSDENTVFVPRIQFYAIEITRNKEGHNDKIRFTFRKDGTDYNGCLSSIRECLSTKFHANCTVKKENGSRAKGDLSVFVQSKLGETDPEFFNQIWEKAGDEVWRINSCQLQDNSRLILRFDRLRLFNSLLPSFNNTVQEKQPPIKCALVLCMSNDGMEEKETLRTMYLCDMLTRVLVHNRFCVHVNQARKSDCESVKEVPTLNKCREKGHVDNAARHSSFKKLLNSCQVKNGKTYFSVKEDEKEMRSPITSNVPVSCNDILVKHNDVFSQAFEDSLFYEHIVTDHMSECSAPVVVYHITTQRNVHLCHQAVLLWTAISNTKIKHVCILHNAVRLPQNVKATYEDIFRYKLKSVSDAMSHKYGESILEDETWKARIEILAQTCLKMEVLSVAAMSPVHVHEDSKLGCFIQYNCARISNILKQYEDSLKAGKRTNEHAVDYSLLTKEEEWQLFWNYIVPFSQLIKNMSGSCETAIQFHKICKMLHCLTHDFSQYYGKVKILTNIPHLETIMHSRMSLLRGLLHVFKESLQLLGLQCLQEM